jgi:hypothetical protein
VKPPTLYLTQILRQPKANFVIAKFGFKMLTAASVPEKIGRNSNSKWNNFHFYTIPIAFIKSSLYWLPMGIS